MVQPLSWGSVSAARTSAPRPRAPASFSACSGDRQFSPWPHDASHPSPRPTVSASLAQLNPFDFLAANTAWLIALLSMVLSIALGVVASVQEVDQSRADLVVA